MTKETSSPIPEVSSNSSWQEMQDAVKKSAQNVKDLKDYWEKLKASAGK